MPRASSTPQPARSRAAQWIARSFPPDQWRTLMRLPAEVMIATINALPSDRRRTVPVGLAGLDAIAAGRGFDSDLVRAVVAAIYAEPEDPQAAEPALDQQQVLAECRRAAAILREYADPGDAAVYRHWVRQVAVRVCAAADANGDPIAAPAQGLLDELAAVLS